MKMSTTLNTSKIATILLSFILLISSAVAQNTKRPGYVAKSNDYEFKEDKVGMPMKGYYIEKYGTEVEAIIAYNRPEFFVGDFASEASLFICKSLTETPVGLFDPNDVNHKEYIDKKDIQAFFIDGHLYANIENVGWRIVVTEGAIHDFIQVVKVKKGTENHYVHFRRKQWFQDEPFGSALGNVSTKNHLAMIERIPSDLWVTKGKTPAAIVADYKANLISLNEAEARYNIWVDQNSSHRVIEYIFGPEGLNKAEKALATEKEEGKQTEIEAAKAAAANKALKEAVKAPKNDYFAGRPATVLAAYASVAPEAKVKKEKFKARIDRINTAGNKVGVVLYCSNIIVNPKSHTFFTGQTRSKVYGSYAPIEGLEKIATETVAQLNEGFGTDVFEMIDVSNIPVKMNRNGKKIDDWWSTKYKIIISLDYNAYYTSYIQTKEDTSGITKKFKAQMLIKSMSSMKAAEDGQENMKGAGKAPKIGTYSSDLYVGEPSDVVRMIQELTPVVNPWTDEQILAHLLKIQKEYNAKFIKKYNK